MRDRDIGVFGGARHYIDFFVFKRKIFSQYLCFRILRSVISNYWSKNNTKEQFPQEVTASESVGTEFTNLPKIDPSRKIGKSQSSFTWWSVEGDCNVYAPFAVNEPIIRMFCSKLQQPCWWVRRQTGNSKKLSHQIWWWWCFFFFFFFTAKWSWLQKVYGSWQVGEEEKEEPEVIWR